ncbi:MAG: helix-turn-helix transcriptional regulator, partial [Synergistaceae bacterium]|nr:helix-turn-helix transcriptional regulator [Synergistaceae bacterium]
MPRWNSDDLSLLAKLRSNAGLSREKAAVLMDISGLTLARYENGINDVPMRIADKMCNLYGVGIEEI